MHDAAKQMAPRLRRGGRVALSGLPRKCHVVKIREKGRGKGEKSHQLKTRV